MVDRPETVDDSEARWRSAGDRIQSLLDSCAASGPAAQDRARELVREVVGLYGAGLERIMRLGDGALAERLATDDLVASLLLVHGLHPHDVHRRVSEALDRVRPYLGSHGGDVELIGVDGDTVRLAFTGSCRSCPSSAVTLELAVEDAVSAAAPEVSSIEVVTAPNGKAASVIPAESLMAHVKSNGHAGAWHPVPEVAELEPGEVAGFLVSDTTLVVCRVGDLPLAYRDHCPVCDDSLAGAQLRETLLGCPRCGTQFDIVRAGAGAGGTHLEPLPLLLRDGVPSVALPERTRAGA
ncbi:NifU family protein [Mycobacterium sp. SMC-2]|uniref:NifU family protein n=1 Tax=Mycobacterium sp. SMC-2 TaxID=2857058 RepID=UPI0021B2D502|nr:NifU family protein [Mycobacterium sp. SMC-2]UXA08729.1 NifU family protein [Mycobacterium sp. SMC-2]